MFAGHVAAGLALSRVQRRVNLAWLFIAALFPDMLLGILVLLGVEQIHVPQEFAHQHYLTFTMPYSHGLAAGILWAAAGFFLTYGLTWRWTRKERRMAGLAISLAILSHLVLDWIVHVPDLPLLGSASPLIGLGLWRQPLLAVAVETGVVVLGFITYLLAKRHGSTRARVGVGIWLLLTAGMTAAGTLLPETPPPATGAALSWILQPILIGALAYWLDGKSTGAGRRQPSGRSANMEPQLETQ